MPRFSRRTSRIRPIPSGIALRDFARAVGRAIVDDDELKVAEGLVEDALDRLGQVPRRVVDGHLDRNGGAMGISLRNRSRRPGWIPPGPGSRHGLDQGKAKQPPAVRPPGHQADRLEAVFQCHAPVTTIESHPTTLIEEAQPGGPCGRPPGWPLNVPGRDTAPRTGLVGSSSDPLKLLILADFADRFVMDPILQNKLRQVDQPARPLSQAEKKVQVHGHRKLLAVATDGQDGLAPHHHARVVQGTNPREGQFLNGLMVHRLVVRIQVASRSVDRHDLPPDTDHVGMVRR